jgi:hypothetical protein
MTVFYPMTRHQRGIKPHMYRREAHRFKIVIDRLGFCLLKLFALALFTVSANAQTRWSTDFSDAQGWNAPQNSTTMMLGDLDHDGKADVCGRGTFGIYCAISQGGGFGGYYFASDEFSDKKGWGAEIYYSTLRLADVNGDGLADICGRSSIGVYCALGSGTLQFQPATLWNNDFTDAGGWGHPEYASTMMLGDLNNDGKADICARGQAGIYCAFSTGNGFTPAHFVNNPEFSDAFGWTAQTYYSSMRMADVNGDRNADICGRGAAGVWCIVGNGDGTFQSSTLWSNFFTNDRFAQTQYSSTMLLGDFSGDGKADVCIRTAGAGYCGNSNGTGFDPPADILFEFSDFSSNGLWSDVNHYGSIRIADVNGDGNADVCAREPDGMYCILAQPYFF